MKNMQDSCIGTHMAVCFACLLPFTHIWHLSPGYPSPPPPMPRSPRQPGLLSPGTEGLSASPLHRSPPARPASVCFQNTLHHLVPRTQIAQWSRHHRPELTVTAAEASLDFPLAQPHPHLAFLPMLFLPRSPTTVPRLFPPIDSSV